MTEQISQWGPFLGLVWFAGSIAALAIYRQMRDGKSALALNSKRDRRALRSVMFGCGVLLGVHSTLNAFAPGLLDPLIRITALQTPYAICAGVVIAAPALLFITIAQLQMGGSWRIGLPDTAPGELITGGVFRLTRHPIYLGIGWSLLGALLMAPTVGGFALLALAAVLADRYVRIEERFMVEEFGDAYPDYAKRVKRWGLV
jgi:protein-S-isoprenylcysteine O-methyltransferase Ste14